MHCHLAGPACAPSPQHSVLGGRIESAVTATKWLTYAIVLLVHPILRLPLECQRVWNLLEATFQAHSIFPRHFRFLRKSLSISLGFYPPFIHPAAHCLTFLGENQRTREKHGIPRVLSPGIFSDKEETTRCVHVWQPAVEKKKGLSPSVAPHPYSRIIKGTQRRKGSFSQLIPTGARKLLILQNL